MGQGDGGDRVTGNPAMLKNRRCFQIYTVQELRYESKIANYLHPCLLFVDIFYFPVALQPYRALADRAAAAGQRS